MLTDLQGKKVTAGEAPLVHTGGSLLPFSTNIAVPPGSYIVRVGVMDGPDASVRSITASRRRTWAGRWPPAVPC